MKTPLVSVIIPTYNREQTIVRAINSVLSQSYANIELLVIDDNSSDNTESVIKEHILDSRLKYIKLTKNIGGGGARNKGIQEAKGDFIAFQDSDDEWLVEKLEKQINIFQNNPNTDVVFCQMTRIYGDKKTIYPKRDITNNNDIFTVFLKENYIGTPSAVVRKDKLLAVDGFDKSLPRLQDWDLFIRLAKNAKFFMINEALCNVYMQENSITNKSDALVIALNRFVEKYEKEIVLLSRKNRSSVYEKYGSLLINDGNIQPAKRFFKKGLKENFFNIKLGLKCIALSLGGLKGYDVIKKRITRK